MDVKDELQLFYQKFFSFHTHLLGSAEESSEEWVKQVLTDERIQKVLETAAKQVRVYSDQCHRL